MNMRKWNPIPLIAAMLVLSVMFVPIVSEDSEAATGDIVLYSSTTSIDLHSDTVVTFQVMVRNNLDVTYDVMMVTDKDNPDYSVSYDTDSFILEGGDIATVNVTLTSVKYAEKMSDVLIIGAECYSFGTGTVTPNTLSIDVTTYSSYNNENSFNKFFGILDNNLPSPFNAPLSTASITLALWIITGTIISMIAAVIVYKFIFRRDKTDSSKEMKKLYEMRKFIFGIIFLYGLANSMKVFGTNVEIVGWFTELSEFIFVIFAGIIVWKIVTVEIDAMGKRLGEDGMFDPSIIPLFKMIAEIIVVLITMSVALAVYGVDLVAIVTGLGLLTTGLSLGAKNIINQFLSGIILLAERPFVKGDKIKSEVDRSTTLVVEKVGYMTSRFTNWSNEEMIVIPNNTIMSKTMTNVTRDNILYRVYDYYCISYESDIAKAKEIMLEEALNNPDVIVDQMLASPQIDFDNVDRNCINLRLSFVVNDHENYGSIAGVVRYRIFTRFSEEGIDIPYDQYTINLVRTKRVEDDKVQTA